MAKYLAVKIDIEFLKEYPNSIFVYGDSAAKEKPNDFRSTERTIGFVVKKTDEGAVFRPNEYSKGFFSQLNQLEDVIRNNPQMEFYIDELAKDRANIHRIWELLIKPNLEMTLSTYPNVTFCWEESFVSPHPLLDYEQR